MRYRVWKYCPDINLVNTLGRDRIALFRFTRLCLHFFFYKKNFRACVKDCRYFCLQIKLAHAIALGRDNYRIIVVRMQNPDLKRRYFRRFKFKVLDQGNEDIGTQIHLWREFLLDDVNSLFTSVNFYQCLHSLVNRPEMSRPYGRDRWT